MLRKATGIRKQDLIRGYPNGETRQEKCLTLCVNRELTHRTETSKYVEEKKETSISKVVASEMEIAQTGIVTAISG